MQQACAELMAGSAKNDTSWMALVFEMYAYYTVWWWEAFENIRKLGVIGLVTVMSANHNTRILIAIAIES